MLPRIEEMPLSLVSRKEALISVLQSDEYVRNLLAKAGNAYYKPWKDKLLKQKHYSPFGDFPPELKKLKEPNESLFFTPEKKTPLKSYFF